MINFDNPEHLCIAKSVIPEDRPPYEQWKKKYRVGSSYIDPRFEKLMKPPYKEDVPENLSLIEKLKNLFV